MKELEGKEIIEVSGIFGHCLAGLKHKIISDSVGLFHSLFITSEGKVLAYGNNSYSKIFTDEQYSSIYKPNETTIRGCASLGWAR